MPQLRCVYWLLELVILVAGYWIEPLNETQTTTENSVDEMQTKIIGGRTARPKEFPWMVSLHAGNEFVCSAFLISPSFIITAAHCVTEDKTVLSSSVFNGIVGNTDRNGPDFQVDFAEVLVHPKYNRGHEYDIAILKLSEPLEINDDVKPVCLPQPGSTYDVLDAQSMGWGAVGNSQEQQSNNLQVTSLAIPPLSVCQFAYSFLAITVTERHVCAGGINRGICFGDSGGPLVYDDNSVPVAIGVASFVSFLGCAQPMIPAVYTATSFYIDWITEATGDASNMCFY